MKFGGELSAHSGPVRFVGGTPDLSKLVLDAKLVEPLVSGGSEGQEGLYEWGPGERLVPVSVLPGHEGKPGAPVNDCSVDLGAFSGDNSLGIDARDAVSPDGSLVVWSAGGGACEQHVYTRDLASGETTQLDRVQGAVPDPGRPAAYYQDASVGDEQVFFTDSQHLTPGSTGGEQGGGELEEADLYEYDRASGSLVDMTVPVNAGEAAAVQGVIGSSENGSYVYFVADGVLFEQRKRSQRNGETGGLRTVWRHG